MLTFDPATLARLVVRSTRSAPTRVTPMPGGASTRSYYRVELDLRDPAAPSSLIAMFVPDARPEEITTAGTESARWPFLEVLALLHTRGIRVPTLHGESCDEGLLLLEDLGDETLAAFLERSPERKPEVYTLAVTDLARAQRALADLPPDSIVRTRAFDEKLLRWELDHFREWGLDATHHPLSPADLTTWNTIADRLAARIASWPQSFVHRDYQSRNLMVKRSNPPLSPIAPTLPEPATAPRVNAEPDPLALVWIDFQDALLGPRAYDLVALLNDSYQSFDRPFQQARLDEYSAARGDTPAEREELGRHFDVLTVQRKLKDAGRFIFIDQVKKNPAFLPYFEPSLAKVRAALTHLSDEPDMRWIESMLAKTFA